MIERNSSVTETKTEYEHFICKPLFIGVVIILGMVEKAVFYSEYSAMNNTGESVDGLIEVRPFSLYVVHVSISELSEEFSKAKKKLFLNHLRETCSQILTFQRRLSSLTTGVPEYSNSKLINYASNML